MSIPLLPLRHPPTGMAGTNQAESGPSNAPAVAPPTPAAAAAMDEALGANEIVALVLVNLRNGNVEQACNAVANWVSLNKQHDGVGKSDELMWKTLMDNVFPDAPKPKHYSYHSPERKQVVTYKDWFYAMCNRHRLLREAKEKWARMDAEVLEAKRKERDAEWAFQRYQGMYHNDDDPRTVRDLKRLKKAADRAMYARYQLEKEIMDFETHELRDAQRRMEQWDVIPERLKLKRSWTVEPERPWSPTYPESSDDDGDYDAMEED